MSEQRKTAMVSIRLRGAELAAIQKRAAARGMTVSAHVRDLALNPPPPLAPGQMTFWSSSPYVNFAGGTR